MKPAQNSSHMPATVASTRCLHMPCSIGSASHWFWRNTVCWPRKLAAKWFGLASWDKKASKSAKAAF
eukprot:4092156-Alexandrium_andersonii.AAC.1